MNFYLYPTVIVVIMFATSSLVYVVVFPPIYWCSLMDTLCPDLERIILRLVS